MDWQYYSTHEDILFPSRYVRQQLVYLPPNDPMAEQLRKEDIIQQHVHKIMWILKKLDYNRDDFHAAVNALINSDIDEEYCESRYEENTTDHLNFHYGLALHLLGGRDYLTNIIPLLLQYANQNNRTINMYYFVIAFNLNNLYNCGAEQSIIEFAIDVARTQLNNVFLAVYLHVISELGTSNDIREELLDILTQLSTIHNHPA